MRRAISIAACATSALALTACGSVGEKGASPAAPGGGDGAYVNVVKLTGIAWFDRMQTGVEKFATDSKLKASQTGPSTPDTAQQVSVIQSAIAQKPKVLGVVPLDPGAVENVIKQAKDAGSIVITHEAPTIKNANADIEAFENSTYGESIMNELATCMKGKGKYVQFVGSLTSETHMAWANAGYALQQKKYPGLSRVGKPNESRDTA